MSNWVLPDMIIISNMSLGQIINNISISEGKANNWVTQIIFQGGKQILILLYKKIRKQGQNKEKLAFTRKKYTSISST